MDIAILAEIEEGDDKKDREIFGWKRTKDKHKEIENNEVQEGRWQMGENLLKVEKEVIKGSEGV